MMSFVYHLSNYEPGREALVASGLLQSLIGSVFTCSLKHQSFKPKMTSSGQVAENISVCLWRGT